jgi:hypothetical protein
MENMQEKEKELEQSGWTLATITSGEHYQRVVEMYKELGIEIHVEKVDPHGCGGCTQCYSKGKEDLFKIYTKSNSN